MSVNNKYYKYKTKYNNLKKQITQSGGNLIEIQHFFNYLKANYRLSEEQSDNIEYEINRLFQSRQDMTLNNFIIYISPLINIDINFLMNRAHTMNFLHRPLSMTIEDEFKKIALAHSAPVSQGTFIPQGSFNLLRTPNGHDIIFRPQGASALPQGASALPQYALPQGASALPQYALPQGASALPQYALPQGASGVSASLYSDPRSISQASRRNRPKSNKPISFVPQSPEL